ncbi:MoaD/ThiS family protein [Cumulibacter manganitolerans]|uniref:MoaD/ThiS family protein n=1 Tax=Cumulibacter manganitolerans TaxID=1884992 RepID=UPI00129506BD|nr:MoaD/ThiS family protein [Cumulibacter manganitolerans]
MTVQVRYFAAAAAAAGVEEEHVEPGTLAEIVERIGDHHGSLMIKVLPACSFLVDGTATTDQQVVVSAGQSIDVLPPFAGG